MYLSKNFCSEEFNCHDGTSVPQDLMRNIITLANNIQIIRNEINKPIRINSGFRTISYNSQVGGSPHSQHLQGKAGDLSVDNMRPLQLHDLIERLILEDKILQGGLGLYKNFVHYDIRGKKTRWIIL